MGRTFGTSLKGIRLYHGRETTVFSRGCTPSEAPCAMQHWWSGGSFRIHASADPLTFEGGFAATWRNGEPGHGGRAPPYVQASAYALFYEW